jgi:flagella basal body P-ring formation protein FlgA
MMIVLASLALIAAAAATPVEVQLQDRNIRLSDLAVVEGGSDNPVIAKVPRGTNRLEIDEASARRLIRNRMPMARIKLAFEGSLTISAPTQTVARHIGQCFVAATMISKGEFISNSLVDPTPCEGEVTPLLIGYDRDAQAPAASQEIASGTYLGTVRPITDRRIAKDESVQLVTGAGPVTITRSVTTVQAGREGRNVAIRTQDGEVFVVPFSHLAEDLTP